MFWIIVRFPVFLNNPHIHRSFSSNKLNIKSHFFEKLLKNICISRLIYISQNPQNPRGPKVLQCGNILTHTRRSKKFLKQNLQMAKTKLNLHFLLKLNIKSGTQYVCVGKYISKSCSTLGRVFLLSI